MISASAITGRPARLEASQAPAQFGFRFGNVGAHTGRTMMLAEITGLLQGCTRDATRESYRRAILEENVLGKKTAANRVQTFKRLSALYALDPRVLVFRATRVSKWPLGRSLTVAARKGARLPKGAGRFTFTVPAELGKLSDKPLVAEDPAPAGRAPEEKPVLAIKGNDEIFVGLEYKDPAGQTKWLTARAVLKADAFFDVTDQRFREPLDGAYVGESLYFRVIDPSRDTTDEKDTLAIALAYRLGHDASEPRPSGSGSPRALAAP